MSSSSDIIIRRHELPEVRWWVSMSEALGPEVRELELTSGFTLTFRARGADDLTLTVNGEDDSTLALIELATDLHVYRNGLKVDRFRLVPMQDQIKGGSHVTSVTAVEYAALLSRRILWTPMDFVNVDQADIAWALISHTQAQPGGWLGLTRGSGQYSGVSREAHYEAGTYIAEALNQLAALPKGFEWWIGPDLTFNIATPRRGTNRQVSLDLGGAGAALNRGVATGSFSNALRVVGDTDTDPVEVTAATFDSRGRWDQNIALPGTTTQDSLEDQAVYLQAVWAVSPVQYAIELDYGWWEGFDHIDVGDLVMVYAFSGRVQVQALMRVHELQVAIDTDGAEVVTLGVGEDAPLFKPDPRLRPPVFTVNHSASGVDPNVVENVAVSWASATVPPAAVGVNFPGLTTLDNYRAPASPTLDAMDGLDVRVMVDAWDIHVAFNCVIGCPNLFYLRGVNTTTISLVVWTSPGSYVEPTTLISNFNFATRPWLRVTYEPVKRQATWYDSPDGVTWTQRDQSAVGAAFVVNQAPTGYISVGSSGSTIECWRGVVYYAEVRDFAGNLRMAWAAKDMAPGPASSGSTGGTAWTWTGSPPPVFVRTTNGQSVGYRYRHPPTSPDWTVGEAPLSTTSLAVVGKPDDTFTFQLWWKEASGRRGLTTSKTLTLGELTIEAKAAFVTPTTTITANWTLPYSMVEANVVEVQATPDLGVTWQARGTFPTTTTTTSFTAAKGQDWRFRARTVSIDGAIVSGWVESNQTGIPRALTTLAVGTVGIDKAEILTVDPFTDPAATHSAPTQAPATVYEVYYADITVPPPPEVASALYWPQAGDPLAYIHDGRVQTVVLTNLQGDKTYQVIVRAVNDWYNLNSPTAVTPPTPTVLADTDISVTFHTKPAPPT